MADAGSSETLPNGFHIKYKVNQFGKYLAYVHIPIGYEHMDDVEDNLYLHGGITYGPTDTILNGITYRVFGCDYNHYGDSSDIVENRYASGEYIRLFPGRDRVYHIWTLEKVKKDVNDQVREFLSQYENLDESDSEAIHENPAEDSDDE